MVKWAVILNLWWLSSAVNAEPEMFEILPKVCIAPADEVCEMTLTIRWHFDSPACLVNVNAPDAHLLCAQDMELFSLKVQMEEGMEFLLLDAGSTHILARQKIELMRKESPPLQQRRLSWSLF